MPANTDCFDKLKQAFEEMDTETPRIAIATHESPDPDSIASAMGLSRLVKAWKPEAKVSIIYGGEINRAQNKTMVNVLNINLIPISTFENLEESFDYFMTADAMPERCIPDGIECLFSVDHHKVDTERSKILDIRLMGATSSIIWEYLTLEGVVLAADNDDDTLLATALLFGIKTDTDELITENVQSQDFDAAASLSAVADRDKIRDIMNYPLSRNILKLRSRLDIPENTREEHGVFVGGVGFLPASQREILPDLARERARMEGTDTAFVFAVVDDNVEVSVRSVSSSVDVPGICKKIFKGHGGGKQGAGAAKMPMGPLSVSAAGEVCQQKMYEAVRELLMDTIFTESAKHV